MKIPRKKIILSIVIFIFTIVLIGGAVYLKNVADYKQAVKETTFDEINISDVSDGVYIGEYDVNFIIEASNPVPTPLLGHRCRSSQEITGSPTPLSTSNHYLWICESASFSLSNPNIAA